MAQNLGDAVLELRADHSNLSRGLTSGQRSLTRFQSTASRVGKRVGGALRAMGRAGALAIGAGLAIAVKVGTEELIEAEKVSAQTAAALKSTGAAAWTSKAQIEGLASSLSKMSGVDDELIQSGQNLLLTFTNIQNRVGKGNDIFNQATKAALDMSVALGSDVKRASMQLGKALNDPVKGMGALGRAGVQFSAAQKNMIESMVESGDTMGAQKLILKELTKQVGGSAKAFGDTTAGKVAKLKNAFAEMAASLAAKVLPVLMRVIDWFKEAFSEGGMLRPILDGVRVAWGKLKEGVRNALAEFDRGMGKTGAWKDQIKLWATAIGLAIVKVAEFVSWALPKLAFWSGKLSAKAQELADRWGPKLRAVFNRVAPVLVQVGRVIAKVVKTVFPIIWKVLKTVFGVVKSILTGIWGAFKSAGSKIAGIIKGVVNKYREWWQSLSATAGRIRASLANITVQFGGTKVRVGAIVSAMKAKVVGIFGAMLSGIKSKLSQIPGAVSSAFGKLKTTISGIASRAKQWGADIVRKIIEGIKSIKMPSLSVTSKTIDPPGPIDNLPVPVFSWNARGRIFNRPTVLQGVGEDGEEVLIPTSAKHRREGLKLLAYAARQLKPGDPTGRVRPAPAASSKALFDQIHIHNVDEQIPNLLRRMDWHTRSMGAF